MAHGDLRLEDVFFDERKYPMVARPYMDQPWTMVTKLADKSASEIGHLWPKLFTNKNPGQEVLRSDEWSFVMILYRLLEEKPIKVKINREETFLMAVLGRARPPLADKSRKFHPLIQRLWSDNPKLCGGDKVIQYLKILRFGFPGSMPMRFGDTKHILIMNKKNGPGSG
jgi:hypothetical protein